MRWQSLTRLVLILVLASGCVPATSTPDSAPVSPESPEPAAETFARVYPEVIKGNWEPSTSHMKELMEAEFADLKELGVNTVSIVVGYELRPDGSYFIRGEKTIRDNLRRAKEGGFAVLLAPNFVGAGGHDFREEGIEISREDYFEISTEVALRWAKISEEYGVEFFAPQNEFNFMMKNFADNDSEVARLTADWHRQVLPRVKEVFTGKMMAKLAGTSQEIDLAGYDYIGVTIFHRLQGLEEFRASVREQYSILASMAEKSASRWLVSEAWFPYGGPFFAYTTNDQSQSLDELQDSYYKISLEEYRQYAANKPAGYIFIAWIMPGMAIKDRAAEQVLREFFRQP